MKTFITTLAFLFAGWAVGLQAQENNTDAKWRVRADFFHQDQLFSFSLGALGVYQKVRLRPGVAVAGEYTHRETKGRRLYQSFRLGFHNHTHEERMFSLGTAIGIQYPLSPRWSLAPSLGLHYNLVKPSDIRYRYEGDKWVQAKNTEPAFSRAKVTLGFDLGYQLVGGNHPIEVLLNGNLSASGPYVPESIPLWFYKSAGLGLRIGL